jgi:diguanylate cyclase (GGDEF)-like protein
VNHWSADILNWTPAPAGRRMIVATGAILIVLVGLAHYATGPSIEFHAFFMLPVIGVSWYAGARAGLFLALFASGDWLLMDWFMQTTNREVRILLVNEFVRLAVLVVVALLVASLRALLKREADLARMDPLTGLPNRRLFCEEGRMAIGRAKRHACPLTVLFMDVDNFKQVNDSLGHRAGDELLRAVADTLAQSTRASDIVGRLGGDEFGLLIPEMEGVTVWPRVQRLRDQLLERMRENRWPVTFSIGAVTFTAPPDDLETLVSKADSLMYEVKREGKNKVRHEVF